MPVPPEHMEVLGGVTVTVGVVLTVITVVWVPEVQPGTLPVTVYVVVPGGFAVTVAKFVALKPVEGLHV